MIYLAAIVLLAAPPTQMKLGMNLEEVRDWTSGAPFSNAAQMGAHWRKESTPQLLADVDGSGLPLEPAFQRIFDGQYRYPAGVYGLKGAGLTLRGSGVARLWHPRLMPIALAYLDGLGSVSVGSDGSAGEIALSLGVSEATVRRRLRASRMKLGTALRALKGPD